MKKYFICVTILAWNISFGYNFSFIAKDIYHEYNSKNFMTGFAKNLYNEVNKITRNFKINTSCSELEKYLDGEYIDFMSFKIVENNPNTFIALVWPVTVGHDKLILSHLEKYFNVIRQKRIMLDQNGARNFLSQIPEKKTHPTGTELWFALPYRNYNPLRVFLLEGKSNKIDISEIKKYLIKVFNNNNNHIENFKNKYGETALRNLYSSTICKRAIRKAVNIDHAMHICDNHDEVVNVSKLVFNNRTIDFCKFSDYKKVRGLAKFNKFLNILKKQPSHVLKNIIVYNSAVLSAYGLRDCNDIDFLHDVRISLKHNYHKDLSNQNRFFKRGYIILENSEGKTFILEDCPNAYSNLDLNKTTILRKKISIDELMHNPLMHFYYGGIKFASLDFMLYFKSKRGRKKDLNDVSLIKQHYLSRCSSNLEMSP